GATGRLSQVDHWVVSFSRVRGRLGVESRDLGRFGLALSSPLEVERILAPETHRPSPTAGPADQNRGAVRRSNTCGPQPPAAKHVTPGSRPLAITSPLAQPVAARTAPLRTHHTPATRGPADSTIIPCPPNGSR